MTEISVIDEQVPVRLPPAAERFVLHWGDMGGQWGVNRSVAQIHAVLFLSERPLTADDIAAALGMARSNVSNSLKELLAWNLIRRVPIKGDRREHFAAETDIWEMFLRIAARRKDKPLAVFCLAGPPGVGKTYLAKVLAEELFGNRRHFHFFDMSQFGQPHAAAPAPPTQGRRAVHPAAASRPSAPAAAPAAWAAQVAEPSRALWRRRPAGLSSAR